VAPVVVATLFIIATSAFKEPQRRHFNAIMIAGAGAAYLHGGLGIWEFAFTALVTYCAYKGLKAYRFIGLGCNRSRNTTCKLSSCGMLTWFKIMVIGDLNRRRCR
jgi:hypothetical protein